MISKPDGTNEKSLQLLLDANMWPDFLKITILHLDILAETQSEEREGPVPREFTAKYYDFGK